MIEGKDVICIVTSGGGASFFLVLSHHPTGLGQYIICILKSGVGARFFLVLSQPPLQDWGSTLYVSLGAESVRVFF